MRKIIFYLFVSCQLVLAGCSKQQFATVKRLQEVDQGQSQQKGRPGCEVPDVDYQLETQVSAFEVTKSTGAKFGFNLFGLIKLFEVKFKVKDSALSVQTDVREFLKPMNPLAPAEGQTRLKEKDAGFSLDLGKISAGYSSYSKTPFYDLMRGALDQSFTKTAQQLKGMQSAWSSTVVTIPAEDSFIIAAGSNAGIQVGDEFEVYNIRHIWSGVPCESNYIQPIKVPEHPIAILQVQDSFSLRPNAALLKVKESLLDIPIEQGSYIMVHRLVKNRTAQSLKRSISIREVRQFKVSYELNNSNPVDVDFTQYLKDAVAPLLNEKGFVIKNLQAQ